MNRVHLRRRPGRAWEAYYTLDGKRVFRSLKTTNKRVAEDLRAELEVKLRRRELRLEREVPVETALEEHLAWLRGRRAPSGLATDEAYLRRALEALGIQDLRELRPPAVQRYLAEQRKTRAAKTVNRIRERLQAFCRWAVKQGYLKADPIAGVDRYPEDAPEIRFLPKEQHAAFLAHLRERDPLLLPLVATALYAGLRRGELVWLVAEDVDLAAQHPMIRVRAKRDGDDGWQPKTRRNRAVPISPDLRAVLAEFPPGRGGSKWAFPSPRGCRWDGDNLYDRFRRAAGKAFGVTLLDLRHTFATMLAMKGVSSWKIARLMGNSEQMVRHHYAAFLVEETFEDVSF